MDDEKQGNIKHGDEWEALQEAFTTEIPQHLEEQLRKSLDGFRQDLQEHPYVRKQKRRGYPKWQWVLPFSRPIGRYLLLAGSGAACIAIVLFFLFGDNTPTWAEVKKRFGSITFCTASIYIKDDALSEPKHVELWSGFGDRIRIRSGDKLAFAKRGEYFRVFDLNTRREIRGAYGDYYIYKILSALKEADPNNEFESMLQVMSFGNIIDTTSLVISLSEVSKDLAVFDAESEDKYVRLWVLRESKLPVRISMWEFSGGGYRDEFLTYSREQSKDFFDPEAFEAELKDPSNTPASLMYMFLKDPGGKSFPTPGS